MYSTLELIFPLRLHYGNQKGIYDAQLMLERNEMGIQKVFWSIRNKPFMKVCPPFR